MNLPEGGVLWKNPPKPTAHLVPERLMKPALRCYVHVLCASQRALKMACVIESEIQGG